MRVLDKVLKMLICLHMDYDGSVIDNVMIEIFQVFFAITELLNSFLKLSLFGKMNFLAFFVHINHSVNLQFSTSFKRFIFGWVVKYLFFLTLCDMTLVLTFSQITKTVVANAFVN
jgi:hypothetical protein